MYVAHYFEKKNFASDFEREGCMLCTRQIQDSISSMHNVTITQPSVYAAAPLCRAPRGAAGPGAQGPGNPSRP